MFPQCDRLVTDCAFCKWVIKGKQRTKSFLEKLHRDKKHATAPDLTSLLPSSVTAPTVNQAPSMRWTTAQSHTPVMTVSLRHRPSLLPWGGWEM